MSKEKRIFIADDDEVALTSLKKLLVISGYEVCATADPSKALKLINSFKPDLILLDVLMPYLGGLEIAEILSKDNQNKSIPIIILSALGCYTDIKKAYQLGVIGYVTKPYDFNELLKEIQKAVV